VLSPGLECRYINVKTGNEVVFFYPRGLRDYVEAADAAIPAYVRKCEAEGKERYNRATYEACVEVAIGYAPYGGSVTCFHNFRKLPHGGAHCERLKEQIARAFNDAFRRDMAQTETVTFEQLEKHLRIILATWCTPRFTVWGSGARMSIENKMIADMTHDAAGSELSQYVFSYRDDFRELMAAVRGSKS
jgi:DNA gyrase/topoisomerase IV subunit B